LILFINDDHCITEKINCSLELTRSEMLSDENINNGILYRANTTSNKHLIVVTKHNNNALDRQPTSNSNAPSNKSGLTLLRPESVKRANNDAWLVARSAEVSSFLGKKKVKFHLIKRMAAAIGDLEWLKQSFRFSSEMVLDKNVSFRNRSFSYCDPFSIRLETGLCSYTFGIHSWSFEYFEVFDRRHGHQPKLSEFARLATHTFMHKRKEWQKSNRLSQLSNSPRGQYKRVCCLRSSFLTQDNWFFFKIFLKIERMKMVQRHSTWLQTKAKKSA
jgi:hypothetical protein